MPNNFGLWTSREFILPPNHAPTVDKAKCVEQDQNFREVAKVNNTSPKKQTLTYKIFISSSFTRWQENWSGDDDMKMSVGDISWSCEVSNPSSLMMRTVASMQQFTARTSGLWCRHWRLRAWNLRPGETETSGAWVRRAKMNLCEVGNYNHGALQGPSLVWKQLKCESWKW